MNCGYCGEKVKHTPEYKERMRRARKNYYLKHKK